MTRTVLIWGKSDLLVLGCVFKVVSRGMIIEGWIRIGFFVNAPHPPKKLFSCEDDYIGLINKIIFFFFPGYLLGSTGKEIAAIAMGMPTCRHGAQGDE